MAPMLHFSRLKVLDAFTGSERFASGDEMKIITSYIEHTQGAPCLERTRIALYRMDPYFKPLVAPLMEGGLCNLKQLTIDGVGDEVPEELGDVYRAGGLTKLTELYLTILRLKKTAGARGWTVCGAQTMKERRLKHSHFIKKR